MCPPENLAVNTAIWDSESNDDSLDSTTTSAPSASSPASSLPPSSPSRKDVSCFSDFYGFTPVPRDPDILFHEHPTAGATPTVPLQTIEDFPFPDSPLVRGVEAFIKTELSTPVFNHSHRIYVYGSALVKSHFPTWEYDSETFYLACLLHDIGFAERFHTTTKLSFEYKGAIVARELILKLGGVEDMADSVCEAIIRHQDLFDRGGNITMIGQMLQLSTILDNAGLRAHLLHPALFRTTITAFPRRSTVTANHNKPGDTSSTPPQIKDVVVDWCEVFACTIEKELSAKPWSHTSVFERSKWAVGEESKYAGMARSTTVYGNLMNASSTAQGEEGQEVEIEIDTDTDMEGEEIQ